MDIRTKSLQIYEFIFIPKSDFPKNFWLNAVKQLWLLLFLVILAIFLEICHIITKIFCIFATEMYK